MSRILYAFQLISIIIAIITVVTNGKHIERFSHQDIEHYKQLLFDVPNLKLLVGARDYIVTVGLDGFDSNSKRSYYLPSDQEKQQTCQIKGMEKEECRNFITVLLPIPSSNYRDKQILVCGTNAYSPECEIRPLNSLDTVTNRIMPINSYSPLRNTTSLITSTGEFFYGGPLDFRGIDSSITRQLITTNPSIVTTDGTIKSVTNQLNRIIRSPQHDYNWINSDANFVHSFEHQNHVYFLFRESAVEHLSCGKRIYSRIGRVCKNDPGMRDNWTSFLKSRLTCSIPGQFPFYFDEIQSVDLIENVNGQPTLYATFNTPENSIHGSAVCSFKMDTIIDSFHGPFKNQRPTTGSSDNDDEQYLKNIFECGVTASSQANSSVQTYQNSLRVDSMYQLMDSDILPNHDRPYVTSKTEHFKFIAVDIIKTKYYDSIEVLFVATLDGKLLKYVQWPFQSESCLIDEIQLINPKEDQILSMKFLRDTQSLYIGTVKELLRVPAHRCHIYHTSETCLASGDPYCGWNENKGKCMKAPGNNYRAEHWTQTKTSKCSNVHWSQWFDCGLYQNSDESCRCRRRRCQSNDMSACVDGYETQVTNCTQHGGWSEWTPWSGCSPSCGKGEQYRTRTCINPAPMFNGRPCQGSAIETKPCTNLPRCIWGVWSQWTNCSADCRIESKTRTRKCLDFQGNLMDERYCLGSEHEIAPCENCLEPKWTDWSISDINGNEIVEQRTQLLSTNPEISPRNEKRIVNLSYCDKCNGYTYKLKEHSYTIKECDCDGLNEWSDWSEWSFCINGTQHRERNCQTEKPCIGHHYEARFCLNRLFRSSHIVVNTVNEQSRDTFFIFICVAFSAVISSCLTWAIAVTLNRRTQDSSESWNSTFEKKHNPESNHYGEIILDTKKEPEALLLNHSTLTRNKSNQSKDFKIKSLKAKMDDSNYT